jgi:hypothetical protein
MGMNQQTGTQSTRSSLSGLLDRPLPGWACFLGWCSATTLFLAVVHLLDGSSTVDSVESTYSTWAIAHGHVACAFVKPPAGAVSSYAPFTYIAPVYPLLAGGVAALTHIGSAVPFPSTALGPHCSTAIPAMYQWSLQSGALGQTVVIGAMGWVFLMLGAVAFVRAKGADGAAGRSSPFSSLRACRPCGQPCRRISTPKT